MFKTDPKVSRDTMSRAWVEKIARMAADAREAMNKGNKYAADQIAEMIPDIEKRMKEASHRSDVPVQMQVHVAMSAVLDVFPPLTDDQDDLEDAIRSELALWLLTEDVDNVIGASLDGYAIDGAVVVSPKSFLKTVFGLVPASKSKRPPPPPPPPKDDEPSRRTVPLSVLHDLILDNHGTTIGHLKQMDTDEIRAAVLDVEKKLVLLSEIVERHSDTPAFELRHMTADGIREHAKFILAAPSLHQDNSSCKHEFSLDHEIREGDDIGSLNVTGTCHKCGSTFDHCISPDEVEWDERK